MRVLLLQLDGSIPNLALLRVAAYHRQRGDDVTLRCTSFVCRDLFDGTVDRVYASAIFERTKPACRRVLEAYPEALIGGTGWDITRTLADVGIPEGPLDYADYPGFPHSIGFTQRGCRLKCSFCVVPRKEGGAYEAANVWDIWRGGPHPRNLLLLDNDFFGVPSWRQRIREIRDGGFKVCWNQGFNVRLIGDEEAEAVATTDYRDDQFKVKRLYTAWDNRRDEERLFRNLGLLVKHGVKPDHILVYMLIGYWADETEADWLYRQSRLRDFGCRPYPMPYVRNDLTRGFQRWVVGAYDKRIPWPEWKRAKCEPRKLGDRKGGRMSLFTVTASEGVRHG